MKENVGRIDQVVRLVVGPALGVVGFSLLGGKRGALPGLAAIVAGTLITESGMTRVCMMNRLLGIDTRTRRERDRDMQQLLDLHERRVDHVAPRFRTVGEPGEAPTEAAPI